MIRKIFSLYSWLTVVLMTVAVEVMAQAVPDAGGAFDPVDDIPLDGGVVVLAAAGITYGIKKLYNRKK